MAYSDNFVAQLLPLVTDLASAEKMDLNNLLQTKTFTESDISEKNEIMTGVRHGNVIPVLKNKPNPEAFPFVDETSCATTDCNISHEYSSHTWELGLVECRIGICLRSFNENFLKFWNAYRNTQAGDADVDTALLAFISDEFTRSLNLATWRASYFGDKSSASVYLNKINGIFVQGEANASQVISITENAGVDYTAQQITGQGVYDYLVAMYDKASEQAWFDDSIMEFRVTRLMATKLVSWLNAQGTKAPTNCACIDPERATASRVYKLDGLTLNGIPVKVYHEWDSIINYLSALNGGGGNNPRVQPNRAILTYRENVLLGTSGTDALNSFDIWHSKDDKKVYLEGSSYVGGAIPLRDEYILAI